MGQPKRNQLRIETKPLGVGVVNGREVLETREGDSRPVHHQLASVCSTDADHKHDLYVSILLEQPSAPLFSGSRKCDNVSPLEHVPQVGAIGQRRGANDVTEVRAVGVNDVIVPVGLEDSAVGFVVALVGGDAIRAIKYSEKIRQQVDQHSTGKRPAGNQRRAHQRRGRRIAGATDAV